MSKEKRFKGLKKKDFVVEISKNYYEQPKVYKQGEIVMCVLKAALPLREIMLGASTPKVIAKITKAFPEVKFNFNPNAEAFIVTAKGKAVCSEEDVFDEAIGKSIAYAKAQGKIYSICSRIVKIIKEVYLSKVVYNQNVEEFLRIAANRKKILCKEQVDL